MYAKGTVVKTLKLGDNKNLGEGSIKIKKLTNLTHFNLSENKLTKLPSGIKNLPNLTKRNTS